MTKLRTENEGKQTEQGALILPRMGADGGYLFECCECALTHRLDFTITPEDGLQMRVYYDAEATAKFRAARSDHFLDEEPGQ